MKKIFNLNTYTSLLALTMLLPVFTGCNKVNTTENLSTPRLFKPAGLKVTAGQTSANVVWTSPLFGNTATQKITYTAQFSKDTLFATTDFTLTSDTLGVTATDDKLAVRQKYYVRVKANATGDQAESKWIESSAFSISGIQLFQTVRELEIKETQVTLRFTPTVGLAKITMTPTGGTAFDVALSVADAAAGIKVITGLTPNTKYSAELFDSKSKGYVTFTSLQVTVYTSTLTAGADIAAAITAAPNNAIIGLNPGIYTSSVAFNITSKSITLKAISGNPTDTKVNFKEFTLKGTGAGLTVSGLELDGTTPAAAYFINCTGVAVDAEQCVYTSVTVDNCIVHGVTTSFMRANRGTAAGDYKIGAVTVKNTVSYDVGSLLSYSFFHFDKLQFASLSVTKSTFYNVGMQLLTYSTAITVPTTPSVTFDMCTFNNLGAASKNVIMNAGANAVTFAFTNNILANVPRTSGSTAATVAAAFTAATSTSASQVFTNNNIFKAVTTTGGSTAITLPTGATNNQPIDLGWSSTTTDFTLPANSALRTFGSLGQAIGDPRWTY